LDSPLGERQQRLFLRGDGSDGIHHRHLIVELGVAQGDRGLVGQDHQKPALILGREVWCPDSKTSTPRIPSSSLRARYSPLSTHRSRGRAEDGQKHPLRVRGRRVAVAQVERFAAACGPPRAGDEVLKTGVLGVDVLLAATARISHFSLVVQPHRASVEVSAREARFTTDRSTRSRSRVEPISRLISRMRVMSSAR